MTIQIISADWPAPKSINAFTTTRHGGFSKAPYDSLNLMAHTGDDPKIVERNRALLREELMLPNEPLWLSQVHGTEVVQADLHQTSVIADASFTRKKNVVCAVTTADCLPLLICDSAGTMVAAIHAGWKGLAIGVIEAALKKINMPGEELLAWMGPTIGPKAFEVKEDVIKIFKDHFPASIEAFKKISGTHWLGNMYELAKQRLTLFNVTAVYGGDYCTYTQKDLFYSFRRDGVTGRMATLIWIE